MLSKLFHFIDIYLWPLICITLVLLIASLIFHNEILALGGIGGFLMIFSSLVILYSD